MLLENRSVRDKILAAAVQLFAEYGYHAATMRDIAQDSGDSGCQYLLSLSKQTGIAC